MMTDDHLIWSYDESVIPQMDNAVRCDNLARHILLDLIRAIMGTDKPPEGEVAR